MLSVVKECSDVLWAAAVHCKHDRRGPRQGEGSKQRSNILYALKLTHVTVVKSPRDTWLLSRAKPVLCVIHMVTEGTTGVSVSVQKKEARFFFSA